MKNIVVLFKREFLAYFRTPVAYVFLAVFIMAANGLPWYLGNLFESNDASLALFFKFFPWLFLFLIPAVGMRLWSEEKRLGTWELLMTLPISATEAVLGKFLAAWCFVTFAIALTFTMPLTIAYLGEPDWGPVFAAYFGSVLMAAAYMSVSSLASALTQSQVVAFVVSVLINLILVLLGWSVFNDLLINFQLPVEWVDAIANFSFMTRFQPMVKGLVLFKDCLFFASLTAVCLSINVIVLNRHRPNAPLSAKVKA